MKLIYCPLCEDLIKIGTVSPVRTYCDCEESWGSYEKDEVHAVFGGDAIPIGIDNPSFLLALKRRTSPHDRLPIAFVAFLIDVNCPTFVEKP